MKLLSSAVLIPLIACLLFVSCGGSSEENPVPFTNISMDALGDAAFIDNRYPGAVIFDYDRDGDMDIYVTQAQEGGLFAETDGGPNRLFRNDGGNRFTDVAEEAGVSAPFQNSTGAAACDFDNNGYQDLYVAAYGRIGDGLDYRSVDSVPGLHQIVSDRLFYNNGDGTFTDQTEKAFGIDVNIRSAMSVACADVDSDGWLDIFVSNRADQDFIRFDVPWHHGHYNAFYLNNKDGSFREVSEEAGLRTGPIIMRDRRGDPIQFIEPITGRLLEGYDPNKRDAAGNLIGEPTGQSLAALFFDHDDDGDPDLWVADDGDTLKAFRNDSVPGVPRFVSIGEASGIDRAGAWMGFALGDYDSDQDLDIFVTNIGYHPLTRGLPAGPGGDCAYAHQFQWGTCFHYLLRNDGVQDFPDVGTVAMFTDVAASTDIKPDPYLPSQALDESVIQPVWADTPSGIQSYDFGFGTAFFDYENDGDQDLYWLGAMADRGEGPNGMLWPGTGRMLRGDGDGNFEDITVPSRLLDVLDADFDALEEGQPSSLDDIRIGYRFHENGKGVAKGDINGDGYMDIVGTNSRGFICDPQGRPVNSPMPICPESEGRVSIKGGPLFIWINGGQSGNSITLRLKGGMADGTSGSNADALGARVWVTAKLDGQNSSRQVQELAGGSSFLSMNATDLIFGLGDAVEAETVEIRWPGGKVQVLNGLKANRIHAISEVE